ncbi:MAG: hypothetical protein RH981_06795 [Arenibacter sp.]
MALCLRSGQAALQRIPLEKKILKKIESNEQIEVAGCGAVPAKERDRPLAYHASGVMVA